MVLLYIDQKVTFSLTINCCLFLLDVIVSDKTDCSHTCIY